MKHDRARRRALYGLTVFAWLVAGHFVCMAISWPDDASHRIWLVVVVAVASCLFTASLFVSFMPPQDAVYRAGMEDGRRTSGCAAFRPALSVAGERRAPVIPIRLLQNDN